MHIFFRVRALSFECTAEQRPPNTGRVMMNLHMEHRSPSRSRSRSPEPPSRRVIRVTPSEDWVGGGAVTAGHNRPAAGTAVAGSGASTGRVPHKQAHTHSVRDLPAMGVDDDEGKISTSPGSRSPIGSPTEYRTWRSFLLSRGWVPDLSFEAVEDALPAVTLTLALGALVCAAVILGSPRTSARR